MVSVAVVMALVLAAPPLLLLLLAVPMAGLGLLCTCREGDGARVCDGGCKRGSHHAPRTCSGVQRARKLSEAGQAAAVRLVTQAWLVAVQGGGERGGGVECGGSVTPAQTCLAARSAGPRRREEEDGGVRR